MAAAKKAFPYLTSSEYINGIQPVAASLEEHTWEWLVNAAGRIVGMVAKRKAASSAECTLYDVWLAVEEQSTSFFDRLQVGWGCLVGRGGCVTHAIHKRACWLFAGQWGCLHPGAVPAGTEEPAGRAPLWQAPATIEGGCTEGVVQPAAQRDMLL